MGTNRRHYDPDKDAKDTRRIYGHTRWHEFATKPNLDIYDLTGRSQEIHTLVLAVCQARWQLTKGVYRFDETLKAALWDMGADRLPISTATRLPEWSVYVETGFQVGSSYSHGAFVTTYQHEGRSYVLFSLVTSNPQFSATEFVYGGYGICAEAEHLGQSLESAYARRPELEALLGREDAGDEDEILIILQRVWAMVSYLCANEVDIRNPRSPRDFPRRKRHNGLLRQWEVGYRFGAAFRKQLATTEANVRGDQTSSERSRPRIHVRRAHWHSYWTGPKDKEQKRVVKWLPPIIVNAEGDELPMTIWRQS